MQYKLERSKMPNQALSEQVFDSPRGTEIISLIPMLKRYDQNYRIYRIGLKSIEISESTRNDVLSAMDSGKKYVQIDKYTVMLNNISSIEPLPLRDKEYDERFQQLKRGLNSEVEKALNDR